MKLLFLGKKKKASVLVKTSNILVFPVFPSEQPGHSELNIIDQSCATPLLYRDKLIIHDRRPELVEE